MANGKISDIIAEARGVFDKLRKYDYEVVSLNRMESIIDRMNAEVDKVVAEKDAEIGRCRDELRATRERRDVCETKMRTALERVTRAESKCDTLSKLVKEMTDELSKFHAWEESRALVARAREVAK